MDKNKFFAALKWFHDAVQKIANDDGDALDGWCAIAELYLDPRYAVIEEALATEDDEVTAREWSVVDGDGLEVEVDTSELTRTDPCVPATDTVSYFH